MLSGSALLRGAPENELGFSLERSADIMRYVHVHISTTRVGH